MKMIMNVFLVLLSSFFATAFADQTETTTTTTTHDLGTGQTTTVVRKTITTTAPAPKVTVVTPANYANCFQVGRGWMGNVWVDAHQVCQYVDSPNGLAWVDGYWKCSKYDLDSGICSTWNWVNAHWVTSFKVY